MTVSGSRTSRRSRTSVRSQPQEEVWVPPEYDSQHFVSGPEITENCRLNDDTLVFVYPLLNYEHGAGRRILLSCGSFSPST